MRKDGVLENRMESEKPHVPEELTSRMRKQGYHFVGRHSAAKICRYSANSMEKNGKGCYKHKFYGIGSHRCIQATPAIGCNLACRFCWRIIPEEEGFKWNEINAMGDWDDPVKIVDGLVEEQKKIISGYKGKKTVDLKRWKEANDPAHVALSLTGEPLFYPKMNELISEFHRRKISTFLVTNGTMAHALENLTTLPTQLYVSIQAPDQELYEKITRPKTAAAWKNFQKFLDIFSKKSTRRVFRLTLIKNLNMVNPEGYAELIKKGKPHYVEVKGFVFVGGARRDDRGLSYGQMPNEEDIREFAVRIAELSGYKMVDYHESSKVALLAADEKAAGDRIINFEK